MGLPTDIMDALNTLKLKIKNKMVSNGHNIINGWINNTHFSDRPNPNPLFIVQTLIFNG